MAFLLHLSNNMNQLIKNELLPLIDQASADPLIPERIIVQSQGTSAFLKKEITKNRGVICNLDLPFLNNFVNEILEKNLAEPPEIEFFQPEIMCWQIYSILEDIEDKYSILNRYIAGRNRDLKRFQLAEKIARVFDNYQIYRPHIPLKWEKGDIKKDESWQAEIWCELTRDRISRARGFYNFIENGELSPDFNRDHISIFGIPAMAPVYLCFFKKLSHFIDIHYFNLCYNYSKEYEKLPLNKEKFCSLYKFDLAANPGQEYENSFLASNGQSGLEFNRLLISIADQNIRKKVERSPVNLLNVIQNSVYNDERKVSLKSDDSIRIHQTHNKMREMEVLYNNLLNIINKDESVRPGDITVIIPQLEEYLPYIKAVFNRYKEDNDKYLPYRVADLSAFKFRQFIDTFINILNITNSRFKASYILQILENKMVSAAFDIDEDELELINKWVRESGIRWGIDEKYHRQYGMSAFRENSWRFGMDRMLLGYAINENEKIYKDILPYNKIEGQNSETLGKLVSFINFLVQLEWKFKKTHTLQEWHQIIQEIAETFFSSDNQSYEYIFFLENNIEKLFSSLDPGGELEFGIDTIRHYLKENIIPETSGRGYFRGEITIGSARHLQGVPAKVIYIPGLNQGEFPRVESPLSFDLYNQEQWLGDRSKRNEDRFLFLSSLMAAQKYFYVSYIGYNDKNEEIPPSSVISDLLDLLEDSSRNEEEYKELVNSIHIKHRLHGFSPEYFTDSNNLQSYFENDFDAARALQNPPQTKQFFNKSAALPAPDERLITDISIEDLEDFVRNPAKHFTEKRLDLKFPVNYDKELKDIEPVELDYLELYQLDSRIQKNMIKNQDDERDYEILRHEGRLPVKNRSRIIYNEHYNSIQETLNKEYAGLAKTPAEYLGNLSSKFIKLKINSTNIQGTLDSVYDNRINIHFKAAKFKGKYAIKMWLHHILLSSAVGETVETFAFFKNKKKEPVCYQLKPVSIENAQNILEKIVELYIKNLHRPIPFFPNTSFARYRNKNFYRKWYTQNLGDKEIPGEYDDQYVKLYFDKNVIHEKSFAGIAEKIFDKFNDYFLEVKNGG